MNKYSKIHMYGMSGPEGCFFFYSMLYQILFIIIIIPTSHYRFNCKTDSPSYIVKLLLLIHHQKTRDRVAAQWLRECGNPGERRPRRNIKTTAVRYFG